MLTLFGIVNAVLAYALFPVLCLAGFLLCRKYSFQGGVYFFLFFLIQQTFFLLNSFLLTPILRRYIDAPGQGSTQMWGMTKGELMAWFAYSNHFIMMLLEFAAFVSLLVGLHRMWKSRPNPAG